MTDARGRRVSRPGVAGEVLLGGLRAAHQPAEPLLGEDLPDAGAVQRRALGGQPAQRSRRWTGPAAAAR